MAYLGDSVNLPKLSSNEPSVNFGSETLHPPFLHLSVGALVEMRLGGVLWPNNAIRPLEK